MNIVTMKLAVVHVLNAFSYESRMTNRAFVAVDIRIKSDRVIIQQFPTFVRNLFQIFVQLFM